MNTKRIRYRAEQRVITVIVPIPFAMKNPGKLKPAKRKMPAQRAAQMHYDRRCKNQLIALWNRMTENGTRKMSFWDYCATRMPLTEGMIPRYMSFNDVPELNEKWRKQWNIN